MKPIIGITSNIREEKLLTTGISNVRAIERAGGVPVVLPNLTDEQAVMRIAGIVDGLLVTGGGDIDPSFFGEEPLPALGEVCPERDLFERMLINRLLELDKPMLGICRGCQMINVSAGGSLYQDIYSQLGNGLLQHTQKAPRSHTSHWVEATDSSLLHRIVGETRFKVNTFHHQAIRTVPEGFNICGYASDGIVEAFESQRHRFVLGVQWHPENLAGRDDVYSLQLFRALVQACTN
ncbi:putative glutamine amidotransferase [Paenibacillus sp. UNCCL117]|uniref:gamma-glutamyl-gamma-aminobutyrate hydrolase family protein n=1 Tax=unclassified Paenibacillus TaxID=185978 RepID=UPI00087F2009|nr:MULTISPECIES: gamma-glutamyl-gamma-aminobutyrate hydrolase family protein [unclassified Paenibacillus]SDD79489.1 putative glutamine amidotransferase [Paenibacillus sp. cl123]SFW53208.1 putative glutamine amidotransferase [Paenibacillus sp. UNCCL117]